MMNNIGMIQRPFHRVTSDLIDSANINEISDLQEAKPRMLPSLPCFQQKMKYWTYILVVYYTELSITVASEIRDSEDSSVSVLNSTTFKTAFFDSGQTETWMVCCPSDLKALFHPSSLQMITE
jgi:hypothetical protein